MEKKNTTLMMHRPGAKFATEEEVMAVPRPEFTSTWRPFSHGDVLEAVDRACVQRGLRVERREYGLGAKGSTMFATWQVQMADVARLVPEIQGGGRTLAIGIRNSVNKAMSVGLCAGDRVFVCDNLAFSSDIVVFRRHTGALSGGELRAISEAAVNEVVVRYGGFLTWQGGLERREADLFQIAMLIRTAVIVGIVPQEAQGQMEDFMGGPRPGTARPRRDPYPHTLGGFYGAATEVLGHRKRLSPLGYFDKNTELNTFMDGVAPKILEAGKDKPVDVPALWAKARAEAAKRIIGGTDVRAEARRLMKERGEV